MCLLCWEEEQHEKFQCSERSKQVLWISKYVHLMIAALQINWIFCCLIDVSGQDWSKFEGFPNCCRLLDQFLQRACKTPSFCAQHTRKRCRPWPWEFEFFAGFASCWRTYGKSAIKHVIFRTALNWLSLPTNHLYWSLLTLSSGPALLLCLTRHISSFYFSDKGNRSQI